ncbi:F0F1 ATP synthase subunit A [Mucilaginibacter antarcticus]|uniref:F0F1 ATP synthase subunit A n=1 Tax=Mucilaginibacter antarcticus TaxID=1855725 RepID=UPI003640E1B2
MVIGAILITRKLKTTHKISRWQCILEMIVTGINEQIKEVGLENPEQYIGFIGTLFLFIAMCNFWIVLPWYQPPTGSFPPLPHWRSPCFWPCLFWHSKERLLRLSEDLHQANFHYVAFQYH